MPNNVETDQTTLKQSDLCLHCLPRPVCPKTMGHCCTLSRTGISVSKIEIEVNNTLHCDKLRNDY